jgi:serine/threonine-protein kinase
MALLGGFRTDQLIGQLVSESDTNSPAAQKTIERLKNIGPKVIPKIIDALAMSDKTHTMVFVDILASHVNDKTLKYFQEGLADGGDRVVTGTAWALSSSNNYNANALLDFLDDPEVSKPALIEVLKVHKNNLSVHDLLQRAYKLEAKEKSALFKIIEDVVSVDMVPDLINRMGGKDPAIKIHLIRLLSKFNKDEINRALEVCLGDTNKLVRGAALDALATREGHVNIDRVAKLLMDPDLEVQNKAVDVLVKVKHPDTMKHLIPALKDESEYPRRAAVEVLNEVCDPSSVKDLLQAIKDDDWWVRARAGDALADIGGPKVINSVLELVKDKDEDVRRTAIEILNATKDETAVDTLIKATDDQDWWVRERAVDALAQIGSKKALPKLVDMLGKNAKTDTVVVRALGKLGDATIINKIVPMLKRPEREIQVEAIKAISHLADEKQADTVRGLLEACKKSDDKTIVNSADKAIKEIDARFSEPVLAEKTNTLLLDDKDIEKLIHDHATGAHEKAAVDTQAVLDISQLEPGDIVDGRYKYIEKIGKGAFGTVLLMQDRVVDERLILKFLNPNVMRK